MFVNFGKILLLLISAKYVLGIKFVGTITSERGYLDRKNCAYAASHGYLKVIQWTYDNDQLWMSQVMANAAFGGHLNILEWLHSKNYIMDTIVESWARKQNHDHILTWLAGFAQNLLDFVKG